MLVCAMLDDQRGGTPQEGGADLRISLRGIVISG